MSYDTLSSHVDLKLKKNNKIEKLPEVLNLLRATFRVKNVTIEVVTEMKFYLQYNSFLVLLSMDERTVFLQLATARILPLITECI